MENDRDCCGIDNFDDDPALKTTTDNFEFKYVPKDQLERVLKTVQLDRLQKKKDSIWNEFCNQKSNRSKDPTPRTSSTSLYKNGIDYEMSNKIIKTKSSTVRILSQPIIYKNIDEEELPKPIEDQINLPQTPRIHIMTDDEMDKVVDSAFEEIMSNYNIPMPKSDLNNDEEHVSIDDVCQEENITESIEKDETPRWLPVDNSEPNDKNNFNEELPINFSETEYWEDKDGNEVESNFESLKEEHAQNSYPSNLSDPEEEFIQKKNLHSISLDDLNTENTENQLFEDEKEAATFSSRTNDEEYIPKLSSTERYELSKFLEIKETIVSPDIDINRFEEKEENSSSEEEEDKFEEKNVSPVIYIRQSQQLKEPEIENELETSLNQYDLLDMNTEQAEQKNSQNNGQKLKNPRSARLDPVPLRKNTLPAVISPKTLLSPKTLASPKRPRKYRSPKLTEAQLEEIEYEALAILSKITSYQTKITRLIEKMKEELHDLPILDISVDHYRRERRANEFLARFTRNHLYQIERLLEGIQLSAKEQYLSRNNNNFRVMVCNLYGMLYQAVASYHKQLANLIIDCIPKKLQVLLNFVIESTKICVHKKIFGRHDTVIEKLLEKSRELMNYVLELPMQIRSMDSKMTQKKSCSHKIQKQLDSKFDIYKPNKLTMYDTVSSATIKGRSKRKSAPGKITNPLPVGGATTTLSTNNSVVQCTSKTEKFQKKSGRHGNRIASKSSTSEVCRPNDNINTLIETVENVDSQANLTLIEQRSEKLDVSRSQEDKAATLVEADKCSDDINNTVIEALQNATKQKVQEILAPLMSNLGAFFNVKSDVDIQTIFNGLSSVTSQLSGAPPITGVRNEEQAENLKDTQDDHQQQLPNDQLSGNTPITTTSCEQLTPSRSQYRSKTSGIANEECNVSAEQVGVVGEQRPTDVCVNITSSAKVSVSEPELVRLSESAAAAASTNIMNKSSITSSKSRESYTDPTRQKNQGTTEEIGVALVASTSNEAVGARISETESKDSNVASLRYEKNVQFTFVTSMADLNEREEECAESEKGRRDGPVLGCISDTEPNYDTLSRDPSWASVTANPQKIQSQLSVNSIKDALKQRNDFIEQIADNPLYVNEFFNEPWKIISKIADDIINDVIASVEKDINFGEEDFIKDFINAELKY